MAIKRVRNNIPLLISVLLLALSLTQVDYKTDYNDPTANETSGALEFLLGWLGIFNLPYGIPWLANPLLITSWWFFFKKKTARALILSFLASMFSASFLLFHKMPANEGGDTANIIAIGPGYWLWLASCATFFLAALITYCIEQIKHSAIKNQP